MTDKQTCCFKQCNVQSVPLQTDRSFGFFCDGKKYPWRKAAARNGLKIYFFLFLHRRPWNEQSIWNFYYKNKERNCCPEIKPGAKYHLASAVVINASSLSIKWHQVGRLRRRHELLLCQHDESWSAGQGAHFKFYLDKTRQVVLNLSGKIMRRSPRFPAHLAEAPSEELLVEDL